jgi:predicted ATPase
VLELAGEELDPGERIQLHRPHGLTLLYMGRFEEARRELLAAVSLYDPQAHAGHRFEYGSDPLVLSRSHLGWVEWFLGDTDRAALECEAAVTAARDLRHPHSLAFALAFQACLGEFTCAPGAARSCAEELVHLAEQHDYAYWSAWGRIVWGWAEAASGKPEQGKDLLCRGLAEYEATGAGLLVPYANMLLGEILGARDAAQQDQLLEFARSKAEQGGMGIWRAWLERRRRPGAAQLQPCPASGRGDAGTS